MTIALIALAVLAIAIFAWVLEPVLRGRRSPVDVTSEQAAPEESASKTATSRRNGGIVSSAEPARESVLLERAAGSDVL